MPSTSFRHVYNQMFPPKPTFTEQNVPDQSGRVFIVTGGNSGVGFELCKMLYDTGATIYMAARSQQRADEAIQKITSITNPHPVRTGKLKFLSLDLNDLESVKSAAATFSKQEAKLDVLWNNAGTGAFLVEPGARTVQNLEPFVGMHCVAAQLFTQLLLPKLRAAVAVAGSADASASSIRVIWTSSVAADGAPTNGIELDLLASGTQDRQRDYTVSKIGNWFLGREFARRLGNDAGILSITQNPGNTKTGAYSGMPALTKFVLNRLLHEPKFGAYTELYAGLSPELTIAKHNGAYVIPWGRVRPDESWAPRDDIIKAITPEAEGGLAYDTKFWNWCEQQWKAYA